MHAAHCTNLVVRGQQQAPTPWRPSQRPAARQFCRCTAAYNSSSGTPGQPPKVVIVGGGWAGTARLQNATEQSSG